MELINNRYKVIKRLKQNRMYSEYLVLDMWNENQEMKLNILNAEFIPSSLIDFYANEFIRLINLDSKNIIKNYYFNRISYIDNKKNTGEQYFYTCEYIENSSSLLKYIDDINFSQIMYAFIEICKAIHYFHLNGYTYEDLNLNNIFVVKCNRGYSLKLKDLATVELEKNCFIHGETDNSYLKSSGVLSDRKSDIYSLAILLLTMLRKQYCKSEPKEELAIFKKELKNNNTKFTMDEIEQINKLLPIIDRAITLDEKYPYEYVYNMVEDINRNLNKNYNIVDKNELQKLNFHTKLIGKKDEINHIINSYDSMLKYKPSNKIFLIQGDTGTGKTRFLEEIKFLLELKNANIYSSFSLNNANDSNNKLWTEILRKLIFEANTQTIQKYQSELVKFFPEIIDIKNISSTEHINENITKYRLINRIGAFANETIKNKPSVCIIDDVHFANEFTIDAFTYLYKEIINNKNIIFIFSYKESDTLDNPKLFEFIDDIKKRKDSSIIYLDNLDREQSGQLIKNMMSMSYVPKDLSNRIYFQSYGNPLFITEVMKELFNNQIIFINNKYGWWYVDIPDTAEADPYYNYLHIPNTIEQAVLNQINSLDSISLNILKAISIFTKAISIEEISNFVDIGIDELQSKIQELVHKGILSKKIEDKGYTYDIDNNILRNIVYEKINSNDKIEKHRIAAKILEKEKGINDNFDELIFHLEKATLKEKAKEYCIENAKKMRALKNIKSEIENYKKALSMVENRNLNEETELLIKIGSLYFETGNIQLAANFFNKAEKLAKTSNNNKSLIDIYSYMAQIMNIQSKHEKTTEYLDEAEKLLENFEYLEASLEIKRIRAMLLVNKNLFNEATKLCLEIIKECSDEFIQIKGNTYRLIAYMYSYENKLEEAILLYEKSIKLFETINYSRGILIALNNIGCIYNDYYQDLEKALDYFTKVKDLSEEYELLSSEILGLINIAVIYYARYDYILAYENFKLALEKALKANFKNEIFFLYNNLTMLCIDMKNYSEAFYYYKLAEKELEDLPNGGMDIIAFYDTSAYIYNTFGDFEKANKFLTKTMDFYRNGNAINKFNNIIDFNIIELRFKEVGSYDSNIDEIISTSKKFKNDEHKISSLTDAAIILIEKSDYKNAKKLILEAKKYMSKTINNGIQAIYYYSKGIIEAGEDSLKLLLKSLGLAKKVQDKELIAKINIALGNNYFSRKNYYYAANYYIEACEILRNLINQIPDKYKLMYVNSYKLALPFYRIKYIKNILIDGHDNEQCKQFKNKSQVKSNSELYELIDINETNAFIENKKFMNFIIKQNMQNSPSNILTDKDILINLSTNTIKDMQLITGYLATFTLATKGLIVTEGQRQDLNIIYSTDGNYKLPTNTYIFDRVRVTMEPLLISNNSNIDESDIRFLAENTRACLCIPIINKYSNSRYNVIGCLYLESDRILNNFNHKGLQKCMEFSNLLSLLLKKHQLKSAASIDKLTGALTRKYLEDSLNDILYRASNLGETFSIIMYDLDRFKRVNDRFGHQTGDEVLKKISKIIMNNIDKEAVLGRYGGEEFIIILPSIGAKEALNTANELREKIEKEKILGDELNVTVSMGVASYPEHGQTIGELIEKVDKALYMAKESGKNMCQLWRNEFIDMAKPKNPIGGILTGDEVQDSRNVLALVELIEIVNQNLDKTEKIYKFLGRTIEIVEAEFGILILLEKNKVKKTFGRKTQQYGWIDNLTFNPTIVKSIIENREGTYTIDWDSVEKHELITGLPDWHSVLAIPVIFEDEIKGVLYLSTSTKLKEFGVDDFNFVNVLSNLLANII